MHEVSLVAELIDECLRRAAGQPVELVRIRHASTVPAEGIRYAFDLLAADGELANARLEAERIPVLHACACGFAGELGHDDVVGSTAVVCPGCGLVSAQQRQADLELLEVRLA